MQKYPTPHINAKPEDFAKTVIMPGDPLRAKMTAEKFLTDAKLVNEVRGMLAYTGTYKGKKVSVMGSGMGMPSIGIYSYELYNIFGVENIIRAGSAGALSDNVNLRDIVIASGASTDSAFANQYGLPGTFCPTADFGLLETAVHEARKKGANFHVGNILSSDLFYGADETALKKWSDMGVLCVEMESAALYMNAAYSGKKALTILTVSDHIFKGEATTSDERQNTFTEMMEIALETALRI